MLTRIGISFSWIRIVYLEKFWNFCVLTNIYLISLWQIKYNDLFLFLFINPFNPWCHLVDDMENRKKFFASCRLLSCHISYGVFREDYLYDIYWNGAYSIRFTVSFVYCFFYFVALVCINYKISFFCFSSLFIYFLYSR